MGVFIEPVVDQFLQETLLHAWVSDESVDQPGQQGAGSGEPSAGCHLKCGRQVLLGEFFALIVDGSDGVVYIRR